MQEDLPGLIHGFGGKKKNIFCHIRDVVSTQDKFRKPFTTIAERIVCNDESL
jgi:hypothetical protein